MTCSAGVSTCERISNSEPLHVQFLRWGDRSRVPPFHLGSKMKVTVCELPDEPVELAAAWKGLRDHVERNHPHLVLLPEFAFIPALWTAEAFDQASWDEAIMTSGAWIRRLSELGAEHVVGARPVTVYGRHYNEGFLWSRGRMLAPLRRKYFMPD